MPACSGAELPDRVIKYIFGRKKEASSPSATASPPQPPSVVKELSARFANLFMICYQRRDISGIHVTLTALTHTLHPLNLSGQKAEVSQELRRYLLLGGFPVAESAALDWLLNHYLGQGNAGDESMLLAWYQSLDDEWVLRKKLREMFPNKANSELTALIAAEKKK
jgi:hypothetical protein